MRSGGQEDLFQKPKILLVSCKSLLISVLSDLLGELAMHVATVPGNVAEIASRQSFSVSGFSRQSASTAAELVPALLTNGDRELMAIPRGAFIRSVMLNHCYHHRGQLSVYLRELNVPVPSIYGPSADENPFSA